MNQEKKGSPASGRAVPTLTEVIAQGPAPVPSVPTGGRVQRAAVAAVKPAPPPATAAATSAAAAATRPAAAPPRADSLAILGQRITMQVLLDVQRRTDVMLEQRLREALGPAVARLTEKLAAEVRLELARSLRELVQKAVADELARQRRE